MVKFFIGLSLLLGHVFAQAQSLYLHGVSYHSIGNYNNYNYGIGYSTKDNVVMGIYKNSLYTPSAYLGYIWEYNQYVSVVTAAVVGYPNAPVAPMVLLTLKAPLIKDKIYLGASFAPLYSINHGGAGVLGHSTIEYKF